MKIAIHFHLKSGVVLEEEVEVEESAEKEILINDLINQVKPSIKNNETGSIHFGNTLIRISELAAVKFFIK